MNATKQFWTLLKFQLAVDPVILLFPVIFTIVPFGVDHLMGWNSRYGDDDNSPFSILVSFFLGVWWLVPTFSSGVADAKPFTLFSEIDFLLTRAVDRHLLYRARACLFYVIILIIPLAILFSAKGNLLVKSWHFWISVFAVIVTPILIYISHPLKHPILRLFAVVGPLVVFGDLASSKAFFFFFVPHQALLWILTAIALILGQVWCERRFARLEQ